MDLRKQEWTHKVDGRNEKEWGEVPVKNGSKGKWGRGSIDRGGQWEESMLHRWGVQRGEWEGDGKGDRAAEEIDSDDDGSRGDEGSRGESEKEMAEETERWGRPAAATMDLEGKYKRIGGGDEASEVSWSKVRDKEGEEMNEMSRVLDFYVTRSKSRQSRRLTIHSVAKQDGLKWAACTEQIWPIIE
jgi:hypothetical protein